MMNKTTLLSIGLIALLLFSTGCDKKGDSSPNTQVPENVKENLDSAPSPQGGTETPPTEPVEEKKLEITAQIPPYEEVYRSNPLGEFAVARSRLFSINAGFMSTAPQTTFSFNPIDNLLFRYQENPKGNAALADTQIRYIKHDTRHLILSQEMFSNIGKDYIERYPELADAAKKVLDALDAFVPVANKLQGEYSSPAFKASGFVRDQSLFDEFNKTGELTAEAVANFSTLYNETLFKVFEKSGKMGRAAVVRVVMAANKFTLFFGKNYKEEGIVDPVVVAELNRDAEDVLEATTNFRNEISKFQDEQTFGSKQLDTHVFEFAADVRELKEAGYQKEHFESLVRNCRILNLEINTLN